MKTILIVDDNQETRACLEAQMVHFGYQAISTHDGWSALSVTRERTVDLVITDYQMPDMNGLELVTLLKERAPAIPVIMVSAFPRTEIYLKALALGVVEFVEKTPQAHMLKRIVADVLRLHSRPGSRAQHEGSHMAGNK